MAQPAKRRFPPAPGLLGRLGLALVIAGAVLEFTAGALFVWLAVTRNLTLILPLVAAGVLSLALFAMGFFTFRLAWKRHPVGRPTQSSLTSEQRRTVLRSFALTTPIELAAAGAFLYLAFSLPGSPTRRMLLAAVPLVFAGLVSYLGVTWRRTVMNRPPLNILGLAPRQETIVYTTVCLVLIVLLLYAGFFVIRT